MNKRLTHRPSILPSFFCTISEPGDVGQRYLRCPGFVPSLTRMEDAMRRVILATAATLAILAGGSFAPNRAEAMTVTTPAGLQAVVDANTLLEDVACRWVRRCGPYGCGSPPVRWGGGALPAWVAF